MDKERATKDQNNKSGSIVPVLACVLNQLCVSNDQLPFSPKESNSKFHALRIPYINLREYLERIAKYSGCSTECLVLALVYIDRIIQGSQNFIVNSYCIHRLLITSVMLAAKFFDDHYYNNAYYAKVGGVTYSEMNGLEVEFLFMLNFDLFVTTETYKQYYDELWNHANSSPAHLCGCINAKVPLLVLPRFDEVKKAPPTMLDESDLSIDQSDLDTDDSSPSSFEIPSVHCGTKIPSSATQTHVLSASKPIPIIPPDISNPATWHVPPAKQDRVIAPPLPMKSNGPSTNETKHLILPFCGNTNPFFFDQHQQSCIPFDVGVPQPISMKPHQSASASTLALKGRDDVMLDIIIDHNLTRPITPSSQMGGLSTQTNMIVESPSLAGGRDLGFYSDFPSFLSDADTFEVDDEESGMVDSKGYDISPSFHPYGTNRKFQSDRGGSGGKRSAWKDRGNYSTRGNSRSSHYPHYPSHQGVGHMNHLSHSSSKRKDNRGGDSTLWQSIVLPVY